MTDRFDYPLPRLSADIETIHIETNDREQGRFTVKNTGGGTLSGKILSRCPGLTFSPPTFTGNHQDIAYTFNAGEAGLAAGQSMDGYFFITTNGGESKVPVTAKYTKMAIHTAEGVTITNLAEFYDYAVSHPAPARRLFVDSEFYMLLLAIGYEYMEIYESLHKDANRERALDNFFMLSGLKGKTALAVMDSRLLFTQNLNDTAMLDGYITVEKSDGGYVEAPITTKWNAPWLNFYASKLVQSDFKDTLATQVNFSIDPIQIPGAYARELVTIGAHPTAANTVEIVFSRPPALTARLDRAAYGYEDRGMVQIINHTGHDMKVEVHCPEGYIRFAARSYLVGDYGNIPFDVKLPALVSAGRLFKKVPYMKTAIEVRTIVDGQPIRKTLPVVVGQW
ncbi:MAG: DUF5717 family protein [Defluviitaleaceae bacterium]|nr:DUF5717 family protein [Defluviitaleaceae bacterium]